MRRFFTSKATDSVKTRALRGSAASIIEVGGGNLLRLISNLILTRLLFPEAFGLVALMQVVVTGVQMFSDVGFQTAVISHKRGDDPDFLNTIWTMSIIRGVVLWLICCSLAVPAANFYDDPRIAYMLPVASLTAIIGGLVSTKQFTANRNLDIWRLTEMSLAGQFLGSLVMIGLALWLQSVWALVIGSQVAMLVRCIFSHWLLPGHPNRLALERETAIHMLHFGKFIFVSTIATFILAQSDRAVLAKYITFDTLGIYNVGFYLASIPILLATQLYHHVVMPVYRMRPPAESDKNRRDLNRTRRLVLGAATVLTAGLAFISVPLIDFLYDPRYALAGPMLLLFTLSIIPRLIQGGYNTAVLAHGDSRRALVINGTTAALQLAALFVGLELFGLIGAILAPLAANLLSYPLQARCAATYKAWDLTGDLAALALSLGLTGTATWLYWSDITALAGL